MRHPLRLGRLLAAAAATLLAAACDSPSTPLTRPDPTDPASASARIDCAANVHAGTVSCRMATAASGVRGNVILGGQGVNVRTITGNITVAADTFAFDLAVENLMRVALGTTDGVTVDTGGVKVFFVDGIHTTQGTGAVSVANADGVDVFTATGQPFFAYPQIIAPGDTSAPKRWKLRFDPGVETFSFSLLVSAPYPVGSGSVYLSIEQPGPGQVVGDSVKVVARIDSASASVSSVVAIVGGVTVPMSSQGGAKPTATVNVAGLPRGNFTLRVRATTVYGDTGVASVTAYHGPLPGLTVMAPVSGTVARPTVRIDADCGGCKSITARVRLTTSFTYTTVASGVGGIHADLSLAAYDGIHNLLLTFFAVDSANQTTSQTVEVPVESSARLTELASGGDRLLGFDDTRLLVGTEDFTKTSSRPWYVRLADRATGAETQVATGTYATAAMDYQAWRYSSGFVYGNIVIGQPAANLHGYYTEIAGDWLTQIDGGEPGHVTRLNLVTGAKEDLGGNTKSNTTPMVAENGDVVWASGGGAVLRAHAGAGAVQLVPTGPGTTFLHSPMTDGTNVAYLEVPTNAPKRLKLVLSGGQIVTLGDVAPYQYGYLPHTDYELRNGWVAFLLPDAGAFRQVWTRSPAGELRQVTFYGSHSIIRALGRNGEVIYANGTSVYSAHYPYTAAPVRLFSDGPFYFLRWNVDQLQLFLGRTAFDVSY
jgi:hypothetical protein